MNKQEQEDDPFGGLEIDADNIVAQDRPIIAAKDESSVINYFEFVNDYVLPEMDPSDRASDSPGISGGGGSPRRVSSNKSSFLCCVMPLAGDSLKEGLREDRQKLWGLVETKYDPAGTR